jgi:hypothetical protein
MPFPERYELGAAGLDSHHAVAVCALPDLNVNVVGHRMQYSPQAEGFTVPEVVALRMCCSA